MAKQRPNMADRLPPGNKRAMKTGAGSNPTTDSDRFSAGLHPPYTAGHRDRWAKENL